MDADGTRDGFDLPLITRRARGRRPAGDRQRWRRARSSDFLPAVEAGADAVLAASVFHFGELTIGAVKQQLRAGGVTIR